MWELNLRLGGQQTPTHNGAAVRLGGNATHSGSAAGSVKRWPRIDDDLPDCLEAGDAESSKSNTAAAMCQVMRTITAIPMRPHECATTCS